MRGVVLGFLLMVQFGWGQPIITFEKVYGGGGQDDFADVLQTPDSGYLVLGSTENFGANSGDILLFKTDKNGIVQWKKLFGFNGIESAIQLLALNNSYAILGQTNSNATADYNILYYNIDTSGNIRYISTFGTTSWDIPNAIILNPTDSTLLITSITENDSTGIANPTIFQINLDGTSIQTKQFNNNYLWRLNGLIKGNGTKFYSTATTYQNDTLGNIALATINVLPQNITVDLVEFLDTLKQEGRCISFFSDGMIGLGKSNQKNDTLNALSILRCDTFGVEIWEYERFISYCISTISDMFDMIPLANNHMELVGYIRSFQSQGNCPPYSFGGGGNDAIIQTVNESGYYIAHYNFGIIGNEELRKIHRTFDGGFITGGITNSVGNGLNEIYLIKTDSTGNAFGVQNITETTLGIKKNEIGKFVISFDNEFIYLKGKTNCSYKIYNINSTEISSGFINSDNPKINIKNIANGIYFLQLIDDSGNSSYRFIK